MKMMFTKLKVFMLLAVCACGLGAKAEVLASGDFSKLSTFNYAQDKELTVGEDNWMISYGQHNGGTFYLGFNQTGKTLTANWNDVTEALTNLGYKATHIARLTKVMSNVSNIKIDWSGCNVEFELYLMGKKSGTNAFELLGNTKTANGTAGSIDVALAVSTAFDEIVLVAYNTDTNSKNKNSKSTLRLTTYQIDGADVVSSVAVPEISLPTGSYVGEQTVTITAEEGASVYYTTNGDTPTAESTEYTTPIPVSETTTIKAIAVKDGESSSVATSVITIVPEVTTIAEFNQIGVGNTAALTLTDAVITAKNASGSNVYIQDATGALMFFSPVPTCNVGDKVSGTIIGEYAIYNNSHELTKGDFSEATFTPGGVITPAEVTVAELNANPDAYHMCLVTVKGCTFANNTIYQGEDKIAYYNSLGAVSSDFVWPAQFDITALYLNFKGTTPELVVRDEAEVVNKSSLEVPEFAWSATNVVYDMNNPTDLPTLTNTSDATPVYTSSNEAVATVAADGKITIIGEGKTTITAEVAATENYSAATASFTLEVVNTEGRGDAVAFVASMLDGTAYAMSTASPKSGVLGAVEVQTVNGKVINAANQAELSWYVDKSAGTIQTASGAYLTATADGTPLSTATKKCVWTWDDAEGIFVQGTRSFFYSEGTGFKNYATSNKNNKDYSGYSQMMTFADGHVRTGLTAEDWGTICLPNAVAAGDVTGADFYPVAGKVVTDGKVTAIVLGEPVTTLEAGVPYVFSAKESSLLAAYSGEAVSAPVAANGLNGTLAAINADKNAEDTELSGKYMLVGNTWRLCGKGCSLAANRAYLDMDAVPSLAAGSYALTMSVFDDGATGIESVDATVSAPVDVYTVSGVRVRASVSATQATEGLQKGLYIINGKKVLVK